MIRHRKLQNVEIISYGIAAGNTTQRIQFNDQPYLRNKRTWGLRTYCSSDLSISPGGNSLPTIAQLQAAYLTLYIVDPDNNSAQGEYIQLEPMIDLRSTQTGTAAQPFSWFPFELDGIQIIWEKSYIVIPAANGWNNTANISVLFMVDYDDVPIKQTA